MNMWGDALKMYGFLLELDSSLSEPVRKNALIVKTAKLYFEMALEKYQKTNDQNRILRFFSHSSFHR
jgi:hypothetical protein